MVESSVREIKRSLRRRSTVAKASMLGLVLLGSSLACAGVRDVAADVVLPPEEEVALGRELSREVEAELDMHPDQVVQQYVNELGQLVAAASGDARPEVEWSFKVVDDPEQVNAMALPGGWIYVFSGLMLLMESEAELAGVLAHEIAHVNQRHIAERLATIYGIEVLAAAALGRDPGTLERIVATIAAQGYLLSYSRGQESEADAFAVEYMIDAGWDPRALALFFEHLEEAPRPPIWFATHPNPEARGEHVYELIAGRSVPTRMNEERYERIRSRLEPRLPEAGTGEDGAVPVRLETESTQ